MAGITLAQAEENLAYWLGLNTQLGPNQKITVAGDVIERADVLKQIDYWNGWVIKLTPASASGRSRVVYGVPQ